MECCEAASHVGHVSSKVSVQLTQHSILVRRINQ